MNYFIILISLALTFLFMGCDSKKTPGATVSFISSSSTTSSLVGASSRAGTPTSLSSTDESLPLRLDHVLVVENNTALPTCSHTNSGQVLYIKTSNQFQRCQDSLYVIITTIGDTGVKGALGVQGAPGAQGDIGATGAQGIQGNPGLNGTDGTNGAHGADGIDGTACSIADSANLVIITCTDGTTAQLSQGTQGATGSAGTVYLSGTAVPDTANGETGDTYYYITHDAYFTKSNSGEWDIVNYDSLNYFYDQRDNQFYAITHLGSQTWMAENLNYETPASICYNSNTDNCDTYGKLYAWPTAMAIDSASNISNVWPGSDSLHQGLCPQGWHLPSENDFEILAGYVDGQDATPDNMGKFLKAESSLWSVSSVSVHTNVLGFTALPGGRGLSDGAFEHLNDNSYWWSSTQDSGTLSYSIKLYYDDDTYYKENFDKTQQLSVRCLKN